MPVPPPTARLAFREMTPHDLDDMAALLSDPEVMRYYPHPKSREEASACRDYARDVLKAHRLIAIIDATSWAGGMECRRSEAEA